MEINIRKVFRDKNPRLARLIPGFLYRYIERIAHQDDLNDLLRRHGKKMGVDFVNACLEDFNVSVEVKGLENIPVNGRYLFASNHPLGGFDGIILMSVIAQRLGDIRVMVNDILMNIENLVPLLLPVNKHGNQGKEAIKAIDETFGSKLPMLTFPAGLCSRKIKGQIIDLEWKKNFISKAIAYKRDIVPVYFEGRNTEFFYNLSNLRKRLGIKLNIEMFYLVDELYKHSNGKFNVTFGKPIIVDTLNKQHSIKEWADEIKKHVYKLKDNPYIDFSYF